MTTSDLDSIESSQNQPPTVRHIAKLAVDVELVLSDGSQLSGCVHLLRSERVSDVFNGTRPFLPFHTEEGEFLLIRKSTIAICKPLDYPE